MINSKDMARVRYVYLRHPKPTVDRYQGTQFRVIAYCLSGSYEKNPSLSQVNSKKKKKKKRKS